MKIRIITLMSLGIALCHSVSAQEVWSLEQCIDYATQHNIDIRKQQEVVSRQQDELSTARKSYLPTVSASMFNDVRFHSQMIPGIYPDLLTMFNAPSSASLYAMSAEVKMSVPVYDGGQRKSHIQQAKSQLEASESDTRNAEINLRVSLAEAYLQVLYFKGQKEIAASQTAFYEALEQRIAKMIENGVGTAKDLKEAHSKLTSAQYQEAETEGVIMNSSMRLALLMGKDVGEMLQLADSSLTSVIAHHQGQALADFDTHSLDSHPMIASDKARLEVSSAGIQMAKSQMMPKVSFEAGLGTVSQLNFNKESRERMYGFGRQLGEYLSPVLSIRVGIPIYSAGQLAGCVRKARHSYNLQQLQMESDRQQLSATLQKAANSVNSSWHKYQAAIEAVEASQVSLTTQQNAYEAGRSTLFDVNECNMTLLNAKQNMLQSQYEYLIAKKILQYLSGHFDNRR